jgi:steroid delta-isomerase-like uncharacterized protein
MTRREVEEFFARRQAAWDRLDAAALAADYTDDSVVDSPLAGRSAIGREAIASLHQAYFDAFTDFTLQQQELVIDGQRVALLARISGTDNGGFMGMPPTRRTASAAVAFFFELEDGRIVRERRVYDFTSVLVQVGAIKAKPA